MSSIRSLRQLLILGCALGPGLASAGGARRRPPPPPGPGAAERGRAAAIAPPAWLLLRPGLVCRLGRNGTGEDVAVFASATELRRARGGGDVEATSEKPEGTVRPAGTDVRVLAVESLRHGWSPKRQGIPSYAVQVQDLAGTWSGVVSEDALLPVVPKGVVYWPSRNLYEGARLCSARPEAYDPDTARCVPLLDETKAVTLEGSVAHAPKQGIIWLHVRVLSGANKGRIGWISAEDDPAFGFVEAGAGLRVPTLVLPERDLLCARREVVEAEERGLHVPAECVGSSGP